MANPSFSKLWGELHAAIARSCAAWGDNQAHHRKCIEDIRTEPKPDLPGWIALFNANAEVGEAMKIIGRRAA